MGLARLCKVRMCMCLCVTTKEFYIFLKKEKRKGFLLNLGFLLRTRWATPNFLSLSFFISNKFYVYIKKNNKLSLSLV